MAPGIALSRTHSHLGGIEFIVILVVHIRSIFQSTTYLAILLERKQKKAGTF